tara:strand:- start:482 stop:868 length:387 start_codon:yes stop_codon:yes gene_type:complete
MFFFCLLFPDKVYSNLYELNDKSSLIFYNEKKDSVKIVNRSDRWLAIDKLQHFSYSCLISLGCQYVLVNKFNNGEKDALPLSSSLSFSAGLLKELNDNRGKNGYFSIKDMVANLAGITVAAIIILNDR